MGSAEMEVGKRGSWGKKIHRSGRRARRKGKTRSTGKQRARKVRTETWRKEEVRKKQKKVFEDLGDMELPWSPETLLLLEPV